MTDLSTTRRSLLGAMAVAPVALAVPAVAAKPTAADRHQWDTLIARLEAAKKAEEEADAAHMALQGLEGRDDERRAKGALVDRLGEEVSALDRQLLEMPAPDGEALMWKVRNLYTPGEGIWSESLERQTFADLERFLLGRA